MQQIFMFVFLCLALAAAGRATAQDLSKLSEADRKQVNAWMAERSQTMISAHKLDVEIREAWVNDAYSSPELNALRARYRELQSELNRTREKLSEKVQELPAVQEKKRQLGELKKKEQELAKRVDEKTAGLK